MQYHCWVERIGLSTLYGLIPEVCSALVEVLQPEYMSFPTEEDWKSISTDMFAAYGMPHCVGALDGKHIRIFAPPHSGSLYFNYKRYFSVILMAACDVHLRFFYASVGCPGK